MTTLAFGTLPAVFAARVDVAGSLKGTERTATRRSSVVRGGLTVAQLSLSLALLVGALLLARTVRELQGVELGFAPDGVTVFLVRPEPQGYSDEEAHRLHREVLTRLRTLPEVRRAALAAGAPFLGDGTTYRVVPPGAAGRDDEIEVAAQFASEGYFETLSTSLVAGRGFRGAEVELGSDVVVLGRTLADRLFGDERALDSSVRLRTFRDIRDVRVVGVVEDVRDGDFKAPPEATVYLPYPEFHQAGGVFLVRSIASPDRLARDVRDVVAQVDALESRLFGVEPFDPLAFGAAALFLGLVVLAASALPARSATRVDPVRSLRTE